MTEALRPEQVVRKHAGTASRLIDGKAVVVVIDSQKMHVLNSVGARIWQVCDGQTVASIADKLTAEFDVDRDTALSDVATFVEQLTRVGALHLER